MSQTKKKETTEVSEKSYTITETETGQHVEVIGYSVAEMVGLLTLELEQYKAAWLNQHRWRNPERTEEKKVDSD